MPFDPGSSVVNPSANQFNSYGYDPLTGLNSGDLGFRSLQGYTGETPGGGGRAWYAPIAWDPTDPSNANPSGPGAGYLNFGQGYNPSALNDIYSSAAGSLLPQGVSFTKDYFAPTSVSYGSLPTNQVDPNKTINGIDYNNSYADMFAKGQGSWVQSPGTPATAGTPAFNGLPGGYGSKGAAGSIPGTPGTPAVPGSWSLKQYDQYTEPGYKAPQYGASDERMQAYTAPTSFQFGNNGSMGSISGTFSNDAPGQASGFYSNQPGSLTAGDLSQNLGQLTAYKPLNAQAQSPGLQALQAGRAAQ